VLSVAGTRVSLTLKEVDQNTGADLNPRRDDEFSRNPDRPSAMPSLFANAPLSKDDGAQTKRTKRMTSPERWELKQLAASGVLSLSEMPNFDEDHGVLNVEETEEEMEVELVEEEPLFLKYVKYLASKCYLNCFFP